MKSVQEEKEFFSRLLTMLNMQFGPSCEIVLHDLTHGYDCTIVDIRNNYVTGREIGGCGSNLGLEVLKGITGEGDRYNYVTITKDKKVLRSSSFYIKDDEGKVIGALCINLDITETTKMESFLKQYNNYSINANNGTEQGVEEYFAQNVQDLLDYLISRGQQKLNKPVAVMKKEEKILFLRFLDDNGAFLISKAGERVMELMGVSKFTFYKYLDIARGIESDSMIID